MNIEFEVEITSDQLHESLGALVEKRDLKFQAFSDGTAGIVFEEVVYSYNEFRKLARDLFGIPMPQPKLNDITSEFEYRDLLKCGNCGHIFDVDDEGEEYDNDDIECTNCGTTGEMMDFPD